MKKILHYVVLAATSTVFCTAYLGAEVVKILIQGDTQKIMDSANGKQANFVPLMTKVLTDPVTRDADFILQMGDIVESDGKDDSDRPQQYAIAREGWRQLDGKIPYVLNIGNNDDAEEYFAAFDTLPKPPFATSDGRNFAYEFSAGGVNWLVISVRFHKANEDDSEEVEWALNLIKNNKDKKVIFIKHEVNAGGSIVHKLKKNPNVVFVLSGHTQSQHEMLTGKTGNKIAWIRTCHHNARLDSYFRVLLIDTARGIIRSSFYSPQYEKFWHDPTAPFHNCDKSAPWTQTGFDFGVKDTEPIISENAARFMSLEIPCCVAPSSEFEATVVFENTGKLWDATLPRNKYKLGSENPMDNQYWGAGTVRTPLSGTVGSGKQYKFMINCTAPAEEGYYNFQRRMLQEGVGWFGEFSENRVISVFFNKVADSSFEDGDASSWILESGASISTDYKKSGNSSLMLSSKSTSAMQIVNLKKNTSYEISFWVNNNMKRGSSGVFFDVMDVSDGKIKERVTITRQMAAEKWRQFKGRFNTRGSDSVTIRIFVKKLNGTIYFDDVVMKSVPELTENAYKNQKYRFETDMSGFERSSLDYSFYSKPGWLKFDSDKGILSGIPSARDIGIHAVTFDVSDAEKSEKIAFTVRVFDTPPYTFWNEEYEVGAKTDDDDKDGLQNLLEFALGGNPSENDAAEKLPRLTPNDSSFDFTFRRHQSTANYTIKKSTDLVDWFDHVVINDSSGLVGDTCSVPIPLAKEKQFFKLEVNEP